MSPIAILQGICTETEQLLARLDAGAARLYEITTEGAITERTPAARRYYRDIIGNLRRVIEQLQCGPVPRT
jgi:hypothetical protein